MYSKVGFVGGGYPILVGMQLLVAFAIILLTEIKGHVLVLDHMFDLSSHGDSKEDTEIHQKDRPEDRDVKYTEETAHDSNEDSLGSGVPKLKFRQSSNKGSEFFIGLCRQ